MIIDFKVSNIQSLMLWRFVIHSIDLLIIKKTLLIFNIIKILPLLRMVVGTKFQNYEGEHAFWASKQIFPSISSTLDMQFNIFKVIMKYPFHVIPLIHLWYILDIFQILRHSFPKFFKLGKITTMQMLVLVEDECWTFSMFSFMKWKLKECFNDHFHIIVGMYFKLYIIWMPPDAIKDYNKMEIYFMFKFESYFHFDSI